MKAIRFNGTLEFTCDAPVPEAAGESIVQVIMAGVCNTDLEIIKGYAGFQGTLGHEFVGRVVESEAPELIGQRVVGEINAGCNRCARCLEGDPRHCADRTVLGINRRDGAFAEYLRLPARNLIVVPESIPDEEAVMVEPLAAACRILEQVSINASSRVAIIGDGKLAQFVALVLGQTGCGLTLFGKHESKMELARRAGARTVPTGESDAEAGLFDTVVEASGSAGGLGQALRLVEPRGTVILKSTHHGPTSLEMWPAVVNEISITGSRCGRFLPALNLLAARAFDLTPLITCRLPIDLGVEALRKAADPESLKVLIDVCP